MEVAGQEHPTAQLGGEESELAVSSAKPGPPSGQACSPALTAPAHTRSGRVRRGGQPRSHPQHRFQTPAPSPISSKHPPCAARASQHRIQIPSLLLVSPDPSMPRRPTFTPCLLPSCWVASGSMWRCLPIPCSLSNSCPLF